MSDTIYFTITAGSPAAKPIIDWQASVETHRRWVNAFIKRHQLGKVDRIAVNDHTCGIAPVRATTKPRLWSERQAEWTAWLAAHMLWRRVKSRRGEDYAVPRKDTAQGKLLAKEWAERPKVHDEHSVSAAVTGVTRFDDWMRGRALYTAGWQIRDDGSILLAVPYHVTTAKAWKPLEGVVRGDQDALRAEYHAKRAA